MIVIPLNHKCVKSKILLSYIILQAYYELWFLIIPENVFINISVLVHNQLSFGHLKYLYKSHSADKPEVRKDAIRN